MHISDRIYGEFEITEPILVDLIESKAVQRLKGIAQFGLPNDLFNRDGFSRYEHCVGVMLLLREFGASLEEQLAGLLHDVSHTAFSHVIDFVFDSSKDEDFQDRNHEAYIRRTDIPRILAQHGMTVEQVTDYHKFTLLEQGAPALCADRLDYAFREFIPEEVAACVPGLRVHDGRFVFSSPGAALVFGRGYTLLQSQRWGGYEVATRYDVLSRMLKRALELGVIEMNDFWQDDAFVLNKLGASTDDFVVRGMAFLRHRDLSDVPKSEESVVKKFRWVDPDVIVDGGTRKLSELSPEYAAELARAREENAVGVRMGIFK
jgi:uncharacterized protein